MKLSHAFLNAHLSQLLIPSYLQQTSNVVLAASLHQYLTVYICTNSYYHFITLYVAYICYGTEVVEFTPFPPRFWYDMFLTEILIFDALWHLSSPLFFRRFSLGHYRMQKGCKSNVVSVLLKYKHVALRMQIMLHISVRHLEYIRVSSESSVFTVLIIDSSRRAYWCYHFRRRRSCLPEIYKLLTKPFSLSLIDESHYSAILRPCMQWQLILEVAQ